MSRIYTPEIIITLLTLEVLPLDKEILSSIRPKSTFTVIRDISPLLAVVIISSRGNVIATVNSENKQSKLICFGTFLLVLPKLFYKQ